MQGETNQMLKQQLRDIHLPEPVSWWPPAIGWWIIAALVIATIVLLLLWLKKRHQAKQYRIAANAALENAYSQWQIDEDTSEYLQSASEILKRTMQHIDKNRAVLTLSGDAWLQALAEKSSTAFSDDTHLALSRGVYQRNAPVDIPAVHSDLRKWIEDHQVKRKRQSDA